MELAGGEKVAEAEHIIAQEQCDARHPLTSHATYTLRRKDPRARLRDEFGVETEGVCVKRADSLNFRYEYLFVWNASKRQKFVRYLTWRSKFRISCVVR